MNVNSLSNITDPYVQSVITNSVSNTTTNSSAIDPSSLALPQDSNPQLSPFAKVLSALQQLQQSDPSKYQQVTAQIATNLGNTAQTATANGNTAEATELSQLASDFKNASQNNTLPNVQDLANALHGAHGHHHHHHAEAASSDASGSASTSSSNATNAASSTSGTNPLLQLLTTFFGNGSSATTNNSLDPLSIINSTLTGANLS